jgi:HD-like signal output (HDOD) protein
LLRWGVPEVISVPALFHHDPPQSGPLRRPVAIVHLADLMAHHIQFNDENKMAESPEILAALGLLDLNPGQLTALEEQVCGDLKSLPALVGS